MTMVCSYGRSSTNCAHGLVELGEAGRGATFGGDVRTVDDEMGPSHVVSKSSSDPRTLAGMVARCDAYVRRCDDERRSDRGGHRSPAAPDPQPLRQRRHRGVGWRGRAASTCSSSTSAATASTCVTTEPSPGRGNLVARIEGTDPDAPTLLLLGHTDVVPVNETRWRARPLRRRAAPVGRRLPRGVGPRCRRHAQPHRVDGGRRPSARRRRLPAQGHPRLRRRRRRGGAGHLRRRPPRRARARRRAGRLRHHRGGRLPAARRRAGPSCR